MKSVNVCLCFVGSVFGGLERFVCDYANWLAKKKVNVSIILTDKDLIKGKIDSSIQVYVYEFVDEKKVT